MQTIELSLEEIKDRLRKGYIYTGKTHEGDRCKFECVYGVAFDVTLNNVSCSLFFDSYLMNCLYRGELYELEDPTLED